MNRITEITKRDILELFENGMDIVYLWETHRITYNYYGCIEEIEFLNRLYDLKNMPSLDMRFPDAESEIWQHTINNNDYKHCWVFKDERFLLTNGSDEAYLRFICEIFHPAVRDEKGYWKEFLDEVNRLLQNDNYELYPAEKISNRDIYRWRVFSPIEDGLFIPYSIRNQKLIKDKKILLSIKRRTRVQIYKLLEKHNINHRETDETGWNYIMTTSEKAFNDIRQFYTPKCYNKEQQYAETNSLQDFIYYSSPFSVIDLVEFFEKYNQDNNFSLQVNTILKINNLALKLDNGKIVDIYSSQIGNSNDPIIQEVGLKELLKEAAEYYENGNFKIAVEKLWDAFERLKTYYSPTLDKKKSIGRIINDMSSSKDAYIQLFEKEFRELTIIGNEFRIRHHETTKIDIEDDRHYDYFYKRCLSLVSVTIQYLDDRYIV